jgi:hypothetical protein
MEGAQFLTKLSEAFLNGGAEIARQLQEGLTKAFTALPDQIDLKGQLGPIQVHMIAGEGIKKLQIDLQGLSDRLEEHLSSEFRSDSSNPNNSLGNSGPRPANNSMRNVGFAGGGGATS